MYRCFAIRGPSVRPRRDRGSCLCHAVTGDSLASFQLSCLDFLTANAYLRFGSTYHCIATLSPFYLPATTILERDRDCIVGRTKSTYERTTYLIDATRRDASLLVVAAAAAEATTTTTTTTITVTATAVVSVEEARVSDREIPFASLRRTTCVLVTVGEAPVTSFPDLYTNLPSTAAVPRQLPLPSPSVPFPSAFRLSGEKAETYFERANEPFTRTCRSNEFFALVDTCPR